MCAPYGYTHKWAPFGPHLGNVGSRHRNTLNVSLSTCGAKWSPKVYPFPDTFWTPFYALLGVTQFVHFATTRARGNKTRGFLPRGDGNDPYKDEKPKRGRFTPFGGPKPLKGTHSGWGVTPR